MVKSWAAKALFTVFFCGSTKRKKSWVDYEGVTDIS